MPSRILLIDTIATHRIAKSAFLEAMQYDVVAVSTLREASEIACHLPADLVVLGTQEDAPDVSFPKLSTLFATQDIKLPPVICLVETETPQLRMALLQGGARSILQRPVPDALFLATTRRILRDADTLNELARRKATAASFGFSEASSTFVPARRIAVVGEGQDLIEVRNRLSAALGYQVVHLRPDDALREKRGERCIDAYVVLSDDARGERVRDLLPELRQRTHSRNAAILVLHPENAAQLAVDALNGGAADAAPVTASGEELKFRLTAVLASKADEDALRKSSEDSFRLAATDDLTGLYNRRYAETYLSDVMTRAEISGRDITLMMIDIDHFKTVNDRFGHAAGDVVLKTIAARIRDNLRVVDLVARYGGEEFLVVMPDTGHGEAGPAADRLRHRIGDKPIELPGEAPLRVTASIGVTVCNPLTVSLKKSTTGTENSPNNQKRLIDRVVGDADSALYRAKADGRDCINLTLTAA